MASADHDDHDGSVAFPGLGFVELVTQWVIYLLVFTYILIVVALISGIFMDAVENITSRKKLIFIKSSQKWITVVVWNSAVANLTLMALGPSAPEISLSVIEICFGDMFNGGLGAGIFIGSAAI